MEESAPHRETAHTMPFNFDTVGKPQGPFEYRYDWKDTVLYALGIGAKLDELDYLYEGRGPRVYPSFAVIPTFFTRSLSSRRGSDNTMRISARQKSSSVALSGATLAIQ